MLLLDTHVLVWLDEGNLRLGPAALMAINDALATSQLTVATISFWEVAMLMEKRRLMMRTEIEVWRSDLLQSGLQELPLRSETAIRAAQLHSFHGDPADRMIVATALENGATLVTADTKILAWAPLQQKMDARM